MAWGGYAGLSGVQPDLAVCKAIARPLAAIAGRAEHMDLFAIAIHPSACCSPAPTAHPVPVAAAIATIEALAEGGGDVYPAWSGSGRAWKPACASGSPGWAVP
ncbi:MAG: hypothetical protein R2724_13515 [Bryobacterales bacterium]